MAVTMSKTKFANIQACANAQGVISAAAMDQRGSLKKAIAKDKGSEPGPNALGEFKTIVTQVLTPHASAILLDPPYGLEASQARASDTGLLLAYEKSGYDTTSEGRLPDLLETWSVHRLAEAGANAVKILLYYNPFDKEEINDVKHAFVERIGAECETVGLPLFLEPITYDDSISDDLELAKLKPKYVIKGIEELSKPQYRIDVLKVEFPLIAKHVDGLQAAQGNPIAYSREEAFDYLKQASEAAKKPFIFLSAGVDMDVFVESLQLAADSGARYNGVLCGRATWKKGIPIYAKQGAAALEAWLQDEGVANINKLNAVLDTSATPWWDIYGGKDNITFTD